VAIKAVDPVGLYVYWSSIWSEGRAGSRYLRTISRSVTRDIIDVTDIGLRREKSVGGIFFCTGVTRDLSHTEGMKRRCLGFGGKTRAYLLTGECSSGFRCIGSYALTSVVGSE